MSLGLISTCHSSDDKGSLPVETQDLSENENEHHADKDTGLLHI